MLPDQNFRRVLWSAEVSVGSFPSRTAKHREDRGSHRHGGRRRL